jgi:hypothetical protein
MLAWHKVCKDGGPDGRDVGFCRNVTENPSFGLCGRNARTLAPGRRQTNLIAARRREHSRTPDELYRIMEACSRGPVLELSAREQRPSWTSWGHEVARVCSRSRRSQLLRLTLVAPTIVEAIIDGRQPAELQLDDLLEGFPLDRGSRRPGSEA